MTWDIQLISTKDSEVVNISRTATSEEHLLKEIKAVAKCYNDHGYSIDKVKVFNTDKELIASYDL